MRGRDKTNNFYIFFNYYMIFTKLKKIIKKENTSQNYLCFFI